MLHGLSIPLELCHDMPFEGKSSADLLAEHGINCWMLSALGYGQSSRYPEQSEDPRFGTINGFSDWVKDAEDAMKFIASEKYYTMGWSGSSISAMMLASTHPEVEKLILYAPSNFRSKSGPFDIQSLITHLPFDLESMKERRYMDIPLDVREEIFPNSWWEIWKEAITEMLPWNVPQGTVNDRERLRRGLLKWSDLLDKDKIRARSLLAVGEWDTSNHIYQLKDLLRSLPGEDNRFKVVPRCSHWALLEKNRSEMVKVIADFLLE